ncbi:MAG: DUF6894 family protein [Allosphingosinicella sp.]|uniref:DUF6894 family protein n=1 Tax=Allosphingosinicella sp. TaxID=2823234 RepID=UPI00395A7327
MPRYYFHTHNGSGSSFDEEGQELPDIHAARREALRGIRSIVSEEAQSGEVDLRGRLDVAGGDGGVLFTVQYDEAIQVRRREEARP